VIKYDEVFKSGKTLGRFKIQINYNQLLYIFIKNLFVEFISWLLFIIIHNLKKKKSGSFAVVKLATEKNNPNSKQYAMKIIDKKLIKGSHFFYIFNFLIAISLYVVNIFIIKEHINKIFY